MALGDAIRKEKQKIFDRVELATEEVKGAAQDLAPLFTGQLKDSIEALKPIKRGTQIIGILTAVARDAKGKDYAPFQHDASVSHFLAKGTPLNQGFMDAGTGDSLEQRYRSGLAKEGGKHVYATKFFPEGFKVAKPNVDIIMGAT